MKQETKNLDSIINIVKGLKFRSVSELSEIEKHAVAFICQPYPITIVNGKIKYKRDGSQQMLSAAYLKVREYIKLVGSEVTGFSSSSVFIYNDGELSFEYASFLDCLRQYPEKLLIPVSKVTGFEHLPPLVKEQDTKPENPNFTLCKLFLELKLYAAFPEDKPTYIKFIETELSLRVGAAMDLLEELDKVCPNLSRTYVLPKANEPITRINYAEEHNLGLGVLETVMLWASKGIFINSRSME